MPTIEKAIELVKDAFGFWESEYCVGDDWTEEHEACDLAVDALKKQDPKKPVPVSGLHFDSHITFAKGFRCPTCEARIYIIGEAIYCPRCGQKLDWKQQGFNIEKNGQI